MFLLVDGSLNALVKLCDFSATFLKLSIDKLKGILLSSYKSSITWPSVNASTVGALATLSLIDTLPISKLVLSSLE